MSDIFLSYARKDLEAVRPLAELLEQQRQSPEGELAAPGTKAARWGVATSANS